MRAADAWGDMKEQVEQAKLHVEWKVHQIHQMRLPQMLAQEEPTSAKINSFIIQMQSLFCKSQSSIVLSTDRLI